MCYNEVNDIRDSTVVKFIPVTDEQQNCRVTFGLMTKESYCVLLCSFSLCITLDYSLYFLHLVGANFQPFLAHIVQLFYSVLGTWSYVSAT